MTTTQTAPPSEEIALLSTMYLCSPSREVLKNWKKALGGDCSIFFADLKRAINGIDPDSENELEGLLSEYTRLFIGPYKLPCPPWESVYTSAKRLMMQEAAGRVRELYDRAGLAVNTDEMLPDHIGVELNFLAVLLERAHAQADREQSEKHTEQLLHEHLLKWVPDFTRDMEAAAQTPFYKALAGATRHVVGVLGRGK